VAVLAVGGVVTAGTSAAEKEQVTTPEHQVVAIYFHRTQRCPTCKRIGAMAEEAVTNGFEKQATARTVRFRFVDFQDRKNSKLAKAFDVDSPTLVLVNVFAGKTVCWSSMPKVWQLVGKPDEFRTYVHDGVLRYLRQSVEDAEKERENSKESTR
jgi:thiol-disulfide isomerase/thioredoxin